MSAGPLTTRARKTRLLRAACERCGSIVYASRKVLEASGPMPWPCISCGEREMRSDAWSDCLEEREEVRAAWEASEAPATLVRERFVKRTRRESTCSGCGGEIPPGDSCRVGTWSEGGRLVDRRECEACQNRTAGYRGHESCENRGESRAEY
jgi:hypothetical protein